VECLLPRPPGRGALLLVLAPLAPLTRTYPHASPTTMVFASHMYVSACFPHTHACVGRSHVLTCVHPPHPWWLPLTLVNQYKVSLRRPPDVVALLTRLFAVRLPC
jgi:hypothetical protein